MAAEKKLQKLELTWIGKGESPRLEPRILIENPEFSYGLPPTPSEGGGATQNEGRGATQNEGGGATQNEGGGATQNEGRGATQNEGGGATQNEGSSAVTPSPSEKGPGDEALRPFAGTEGGLLIHGDNLLALKALEADYAGKVKCIYIDPPYNTGSAFEHYDDGIEHSQWLNLMKPRLTLLRNLLSEDGSIWISIDDNECHYLKVLCDEVFGRRNFVSNVIWEKKYAVSNDAMCLSVDHDYILVYTKNKDFWNVNKLPRSDKSNSAYKNPDNDPRGEWQSDNYTCNKSKYERPNLYYSITNPYTGAEVFPKETAVWRYSEERHKENEANDLVYWGVDGKNSVPRFKRLLSKVAENGAVPSTIWKWTDVGHNQDAKREQLSFNKIAPFTTPKPERLIERILFLSTQPGDLVLDSFLGSGTTAAVAHKMGRRWIGIELGEHAKTHCYPRLKAVVDGEQGGISKAVGWKGGGGFKFYTLAPSLLNRDSFGNWVISKEYNADMLAAAMAKQEGFQYAPDGQTFWKQGRSSESDFIYTTTHFLSHAILSGIAGELGPDESLLVCCTQYEAGLEKAFPNINIQKIPAFLLRRCEFGRDDYSLNIINSPLAAEAAAPAAEVSGNSTPADLFSNPA